MDSDHINYLIYRYLQESGFHHSSFTFGQESGVTHARVAGTKIPPGSLILQLQRALNYVQAEVSLGEDGVPADMEDLASVEALTLIESVQPEVVDKRREELFKGGRSATDDGAGPNTGGRADDGDAPMDVDVEAATDQITKLKGHNNEVFACAWNPRCDMIASGSGDSTARIWSLEPGVDPNASPLVLRHFAPQQGHQDSKDVTTLDWNHEGTLLATGSYDGAGRIWTKSGNLENRLAGHSGPIFSLKWNKLGNYLVTSSVDCTAIVWETSTGQIKQRFSFHSAPCLDVDWRDNECFASCSQDMNIYVCEIGQSRPTRKFQDPCTKQPHTAHIDEVNAIKWTSDGKYLASCSDDCTAKVWSRDKNHPLHVLKQGDKIYSLKWSEPGSSKLPLMLASASFDNTTKVWDALLGLCRYTLKGHAMPVYSVAFSPDSRFLATGAFDNKMLVWAMETGQLVKSHHGGGGIFEVCWNSTGDKIAACYADNTVNVLDFGGA